MEKKKIIRAADYLPKQDSCDGQDFELSASEQMLYNLFGNLPDYGNRQFEDIWQKVFDADNSEMICYCLEQSVDVIGANGEPLAGWRDIAVMLKAIECGIIKLDKKESE